MNALFRRKIKIFQVQPENDDYLKTDIFEFSDFLKKKLNASDNYLKLVIVKRPGLLNITIKDLDSMIDLLKNELLLDESQLKRIIYIYPKILDKNLIEKVNSSKYFFKEWVDIDSKKLGQILTKFPFIFDFPNNDYKENIKILFNNKFT